MVNLYVQQFEARNSLHNYSQNMCTAPLNISIPVDEQCRGNFLRTAWEAGNCSIERVKIQDPRSHDLGDMT